MYTGMDGKSGKKRTAPERAKSNVYYSSPPDCMRAGTLLDNYVFSRDDVSESDAAFLDAHLRECRECKTKYLNLLQWKKLMTSAKYEAPRNLKSSVMANIDKERKKISPKVRFKKNMIRISAAAASVLMLTASLLIVSVMDKTPMDQNMSAAEDMAAEEMYLYSAENAGGNEKSFDAGEIPGEAEEDAAVEITDQHQYWISGYDDDVTAENAENKEPDGSLSLPAAEPENAASQNQENEYESQTESGGGEENSEYEKRVAITSVASAPPPIYEYNKFIDAVYMLDYVNIISGEENVKLWLEEKIDSDACSDEVPEEEKAKPEAEPEADSESEEKFRQESVPLLYEALMYFEINIETLSALDRENEGEAYHLGDEVINALYSQNWEALYKERETEEN